MPARVMAVDNSQALLTLYADILSGEGYEAFTAYLTPTISAEICEVKPDVLIMDYPPGKDNITWELLQRLNTSGWMTKVAVVLCTTQVKAVEEMRNFLVNQHITVVFKPFDIEQLLTAVEQAFSWHRDIADVE